MEGNPAQPLEVAVSAAREAGAVLLQDFLRAGGPRGHGGDKAEADTEAETRIRSRLLHAFPRFGYLGEETGRALGEAGAPIWLVDPNDGTRDYLRGSRGSAVSIGLIREGRPVLGVVFAFGYPDGRGDLFAWAEGCGGILRNGREVEARLVSRLTPQDAVLISGQADRDPEAHLECSAPARYRTVPSVAHRLALVASGEGAAAVSLHAPGAWDYAAGQALLRGAGGVLLDESGRDVGYAEDGSSGTRRAFGGSRAATEALAGRPWESVSHRSASSDLLRPEPGASVSDDERLSRAQGCLLGQVAGDSLGSLVESMTAAEIGALHPGGPRLLEDGGRWQTLGGQPTDDSEMALVLARALVATGAPDPERILADYRRWYRTEPFGVGSTTRAALVGYVMGQSEANSSLMRASPLGIFAHAMSPHQAGELGRAESALTHPNPVCRDAVGAFVVSLGHALRGEGKHAAYEGALAWARSGGADRRVVEEIEAAAGSPPILDGAAQGHVLLSLRNALFEMLYAPSLEAGVVATVRRGGKTDTHAAVAGALLGAVHGREGVPAQWRLMVLSCRPHPLRARRPRPMACWPVDVLELAERLLLAPGRPGRPPTPGPDGQGEGGRGVRSGAGGASAGSPS